MLTRYKALQIGLILAGDLCLAQQAMALGLGELTIESALAEPLDASIELHDVAGLDPAQISVSLGSEEDFTGAGAELMEVATQVQFDVEIDGATNRIHLTTRDGIEEPFLDLILNVSWPDGTLQREYTILLNLPGTVATGDDSFVIPTVANPTSEVADSPSDESAGPTGDPQGYAVENGDSMWEIAARTRPDSSVSMQQMMLAIQRANEDAFINNNINRVRAGRVLRIPTLQEINLLDQDTAVTQISQQNQELAVQPLAVNRTAANNNPAPEQDELTVLTDDQSDIGAGNTDLEATLAALENDIMMSEESLDRARLENTELTGRFKMLEEELDLLQNIIVVEEARIAQLQADLATQNETAAQALATTEEAASVLAAQQPEPQPGIVGNVTGWLQNTAVLLGVIVALFLLILGYLFWQRRRMTAAVYAFDSGIPELETADNSSFAPVAKTGGGIMGWISHRGSRKADDSADEAFASDAGRAPAVSPAFSRDITAIRSDEFGDDELDVPEDRLRHSDDIRMTGAALNPADPNPDSDAFPGSSFQNDNGMPASWQNDSTSPTTRAVVTELDDAELADALIAEARDMDADPVAIPDAPSASIDNEPAAELQEAQREAEALAALMTSDAETTAADIPESFEFTLKSAPEALAEESVLEQGNIESFDFQLTEPAAENAPENVSAESGMSDEELQLSTLLLDEEDGDMQNSAPMDECDTKLDLAVAYEAMGDIDGALEILGEVLSDGNSTQVAEATRLKGMWKNS